MRASDLQAAATSEDAAPPCSSKSPSDPVRHPRNAPTAVRGPTLPEQPKDPDHANPARQPGFRHASEPKRERDGLESGLTLDPPWPHRMAKKNDLRPKPQ